MLQYTFRVNLLDFNIYENTPAGDRQSLIDSLNTITVWIPYVDRPLKHGDTFQLYGAEGDYVRTLYFGSSSRQDSQQVLELETTRVIPDVDGLDLDAEGTDVYVYWYPDNEYYTEVSYRLDDEDWITLDLIEPGVGEA